MSTAVSEPVGTELPMREATATSRRVHPLDVVTSWPVARIIGSRDIKVKYKQSILGPAWLLIQPLGLLTAITIAFSGVTDVSTGDVPYVVFGLVGVCVWNFISMTLAIAPQAFLTNQALIKRSPTPRMAFITASIVSNLPLLAFMLLVTVVASTISEGFRVQFLLMPILVAWLLVFVWSIVLLIAPVASRFRDAVAVVPLLIQVGVFLAPIGYSLESAPSNIKLLLSINPVTGIVESWRWMLLGLDPSLEVIAVSAGWTVILLFAGWQVYRRMEVRLADFV
ncbi:MAG: ABC transporter permease [Solirubrobacteraceae bacterium]